VSAARGFALRCFTLEASIALRCDQHHPIAGPRVS
jgi:hypothetical protein